MYQRKIKQILEAAGITNVDPRHIEAYMRLKHGTLDGISGQQLIKSIHVCLADIDTDGILNAEKLAQSYAL